LVQWGFYLSHQKGPFTLMKQKVHPHNLDVALHHVLNHREWLEQNGVSALVLLDRCVKNQMLTEAQAKQWKKQWAQTDKDKKLEQERLRQGNVLRSSHHPEK